jgi:hypothetical protein
VRPVGQTFTAGSTGLLDTVSLFASPTVSLAGGTVEIRTVSGGLPTTTVLASQTVTSAALNAMVQTTFAAPASVTAGTVYALVFAPASGFTTLGTGVPYAGGEAVVTQDDGTTWQSSAGFFGDWAFETYVTTTPVLSQSKVAPPTVVAGTNLTYTLEVANPTPRTRP